MSVTDLVILDLKEWNSEKHKALTGFGNENILAFAKWLSEQIGRNPATVSKWCTNTIQPSMDTLLDIANALEMNIQDLLIPTNQNK